MKKHFTLPLIAAALLLTGATASPSADTDSSSGAQIDLDTIKENVKKRIESVVKGETSINLEKVAAAYMGKVESVANTSLSLQTISGVKQASTTPSTVILRLPGNKSTKFDDISIDEYVTILGYLNPDGVLQARRLLVQSQPPTPSTNKPFYGTITQLDVKARTITLENPATQETKNFVVSRKMTGATLTDEAVGQKALALYTPGATKDNDSVIYNLRLKKASSVLGATTASPSATTPPELKK